MIACITTLSGRDTSPTAVTRVLPAPPPYPTRRHTGPGSARLNAPGSVSSETYTQYRHTYFKLDTFLQEHSLLVSSETIADYLSGTSSGSTAQHATHLRLFARMGIIPQLDDLSTIVCKSSKRTHQQSTTTAPTLVPAELYQQILEPPPDAPANVVRLAAHLATGTRCKEICQVTRDNLAPTGNLLLPPSKHQGACSISITPLAQRLIHRIQHTTNTNSYQQWIKLNYSFTGKSVRRSFASAQHLLGVPVPRISRALRHKASRTTVQHYIFPVSGLSNCRSTLPHQFILGC